jgi:hypothetical protein
MAKDRYEDYDENQLISIIRFISEISRENQNAAGLCKELFHPATCPVVNLYTCLNKKIKGSENETLDECFGRTFLAVITLIWIKGKLSNEEILKNLTPFLKTCYVSKKLNQDLRRDLQSQILKDARAGKIVNPETYMKRYKEYVDI